MQTDVCAVSLAVRTSLGQRFGVARPTMPQPQFPRRDKEAPVQMVCTAIAIRTTCVAHATPAW
jgi:hypothetical protein